jgi:alanyl-tRNA synthetase
VLEIGSSKELCGGCHVSRTGDIGVFKITAESGVAAGVRRVEAVAGSVAFAYMQGLDKKLSHAADLLKAQPSELDVKITALLDHVKALEKQLNQAKSKLAASAGDDLAAQAKAVGSAHVLAASLEGADSKALRETLDKLRDKLKSAVVLLASTEGGKVSLIAGVTPDLVGKIKAGELVNFVALQVGGKGGGRPDMAQAGGTDVAAVPSALASVHAWVATKLA